MKGDNCSFRHDINKRGKVTPSNPSPNSFMQQSERKSSRTRSPRGRSPSGRMFRLPCKDYLKGTCTNSFCEKWHPPECLFYKTKSGCRFGKKCSYAHRQVDEQPTKRSKKNNDKSAVAILKKGDWQEREPVTDQCHDRLGKPGKNSDKKLGQNSSKRRSSDARQLGCVFQDMTPPQSILRKSTDMQKPIQRVKFNESSEAQIRTLLDEQKQKVLAECQVRVSHHELQAAQAEEERRLLQGQLWRQKLEFREARQQSLTGMEELRKFQSSTFDTVARRKLIEDQNTIMELSGRVQELQNEVNCMNDSKDFQDAESVAVEIPTLPVDQCHSHLIQYLKGC